MEDITIIGGGLMGSSAAWELSKLGGKLVLLEKQHSKYENGSSFGEARFSRSLGQKDNIFSYLQKVSIDETKQLIGYLNDREKGVNHSMEDIYRTSPVTYIYYKSQQNAVTQLLTDQLVKFEFAPNKEKASELFDMKIPDSAMIIREYKKYSGNLNPRVLISKLHKGIVHSGNRVLYNKQVTSLKKVEGIFEIRMKNTLTGKVETLQSKKVIAAAGPYNGSLVKDIAPCFKKLIIPKRIFTAFLKIKPSTYKTLSIEQRKKIENFYPVIDMNAEIFYSMIETYSTDKTPILKIGGHLLRTEIENLDEIWKKDLEQSEIHWSKKSTSKYMEMLNLPVGFSDLEYVRGYSCVYSLTKSEIPYVTNIYDKNNEIDSNCILVGGMSGTGAKASLAYGLIAANLIMNKDNNSLLYQKAKLSFGHERLLKDIKKLTE